MNTPLADVPLVDLLWRVRTVALAMPGLIAVLARTVGRWSLVIVGTRVAHISRFFTWRSLGVVKLLHILLEVYLLIETRQR